MKPVRAALGESAYQTFLGWLPQVECNRPDALAVSFISPAGTGSRGQSLQRWWQSAWGFPNGAETSTRGSQGAALGADLAAAEHSL